MIAFKIGARARKFMLEGFLIEGYDYLYAHLNDAKEKDPELHQLLELEREKFDKRVAQYEEEE